MSLLKQNIQIPPPLSNDWHPRPGKSCKSSSRGKLRYLQCPQNSVIRDNGQRETCVSNVGMAWWNPQILIAYHQSKALQPQFWALNPPLSILLPKISIVNSSFSILSQKYRILNSKWPQNSVISAKMSASAACTTCSFFQVWRRASIDSFLHHQNFTWHSYLLLGPSDTLPHN